MPRSLFASLALLLTLAFSLLAQPPADYAGQYVLRLGARNFLVINLHYAGGTWTGSLSRPRHSTLGSTFSNISAEVITEPVASAVVQEDHLQLIARNPNDSADTEEYDLRLVPPDRASLTLGIPITPWILVRVPDSPLLPVAADWDPHQTYYLDETDQSNPAMQRIMDEDQAPRQNKGMMHADWANINKQDEERRKQVRDLLSRGALHTGKDFEQVAFVFQHGSTPDDYLLAHTLALLAIARGNAGALWIATATLDRYLESVKQPQMCCTQFSNSGEGKHWTQEPYNRTLISDELRQQLGVPSQAAQQEQLDQYKTANQQ